VHINGYLVFFYSLKLTQVAIEASKSGPKAALESLQALFVLFRRMFSSLCRTDDNSSAVLPAAMAVHHRPSADVGGATDRAHSRVSTSSIPNTGTATPRGGGGSYSLGSSINYSFRSLDLQICLWLTAASLYRQSECFDEAKAAVEEAEKLSESWSRLESKVHKSPSRVCKPVGADGIFPSVVQQLQEKRKGTLKKSIIAPKKSEEIKPHWGLVSKGLRRVLADILYEVKYQKNTQR
jgi:hypothetical protein